MKIVTALEDERTISTITTQGASEDDRDYYSAERGVEIHVYGENGMYYCELPWFAIVEEGEVTTRLNGAAVETITYFPGA